MPEPHLALLLRRIRNTAVQAENGISDAQLLERFTANRDEAAFELLVWRHRRLVFGVCWRVLNDLHDAEDAFQATFLALARKAGRIGKREALAAWLYRVALRASLTLRTRRARRATREQPSVAVDQTVARPESMSALERSDLSAVLDQELNRLPEQFRTAAVLCYLRGMSVDEAARQVGCPRGTLASRLARARERLRVRLTRRGLALSAGTLAVALSEGTLSAAAPDSLVGTTVRVAAAVIGIRTTAGAVPLKILALSEEVLRAMLLKKVVTSVLVLAVCASALLLAGGLTLRIRAETTDNAVTARSGEKPSRPQEDPNSQPASKKAAQPPSRPVTVTRPIQRMYTPYQDYAGRLTGRNAVFVRPSVSGKLEKTYCQSAAKVKKGDLLFRLDGTEFEIALASAKAALTEADTNCRNAEANLRRTNELVKNGIATAKSAEQDAQEVARTVALRYVRRAEFERAQHNLDATRIVSPVDGSVNLQGIHVGASVTSDGRGATLLAVITNTNAIGVRFEMDELAYLRYQRLRTAKQVDGAGSPLRVGLIDEEGFPHAGFMESFGNQFNPETSTITVTGVIPNPDPLLLAGMTARVRVAFGKPRQVLVIAERAICSSVDSKYVLVVNDLNRVERRPVTIGALDRGRVIEEGLRADDRVVTTGIAGLQGGDLVEIQRSEPARELKKQK